jgi:hypothetical protein
MKSDSYVQTAIVQLLALKLRTGTSLAEMQEFAALCIDRAAKSCKAEAHHQGLDIHRLGSVLRTWHTEARYLSKDGSPRPLKLSGRISLKTLVKSYYPTSKFEQVFQKLREARLIRLAAQDNWIPTARHARISGLSLETLEHLSEGVARYVETVTKNVTARSDEEVLFERSCKVSRLPKHKIQEFRKYLNQQAIAFITAVDDWLESRNSHSKRESRRTVTAGVYTFAYIAPRSEKHTRG